MLKIVSGVNTTLTLFSDFFGSALSIGSAASLLNVSDALGFIKFQTFAAKTLQSTWPSQLEPSLIGLELQWQYSPIKMIELARKYNLHDIFKRTFYELLRIPEVFEVILPLVAVFIHLIFY